MTNHPYPPLPGEQFCAWMYRGDSVNAFDRPASQVSDPYFNDKGYTAEPLFTAAQMQAYVDADREQRKPLADEPQILPRNGWIDPATGTRVPTWEQIHEAWYRIGADIHGLSWEQFTTALRKENTVIVSPPRPDAGNN